MNYQTQHLIQTMVTVIAMGMCIGPPTLMLQAGGMNIEQMLRTSIHEEVEACISYEKRAGEASRREDYDTATLFMHLASEEKHHVEELSNRLREVVP